MRLLSPAVAAGLLALGAPALAGVDDAAHKKCLEARDYAGCIEIQRKSVQKSVNNDKTTPTANAKECRAKLLDFDVENELLFSGKERTKICERLVAARSVEEKRQIAKENGFNWDAYSGFQASNTPYMPVRSSNSSSVSSSRRVGLDANGCPAGTNMVTIDNRWNFLFFRGGKVKEIGCMSPQQLANFRAQVELGNQEATRRIWRDAVNNMNADRRNQQLIDAINQPVYCNTNSTTTGSIYGSGYGSADLYGSTSSSTSCY